MVMDPYHCAYCKNSLSSSRLTTYVEDRTQGSHLSWWTPSLIGGPAKLVAHVYLVDSGNGWSRPCQKPFQFPHPQTHRHPSEGGFSRDSTAILSLVQVKTPC